MQLGTISMSCILQYSVNDRIYTAIHMFSRRDILCFITWKVSTTYLLIGNLQEDARVAATKQKEEYEQELVRNELRTGKI